jgi:hypothetical protein
MSRRFTSNLNAPCFALVEVCLNYLVHRLVLEGGALPLNVLGQRVEEWAENVAGKV